MENLIKFLTEILEKSNAYSIVIDENGKVSIKSMNETNEELEQIKEDINSIDTDIFTETAKEFKSKEPKLYEVLNTVEDEDVDIEAVKSAYAVYKQYVQNHVEWKIAEINDNIQDLEDEKERLINKYLGE